VIVMRLNAGDKVVGIAAFRAGLAQRGEVSDNAPDGSAPKPDGGKPQS
jgi:hypothetical protein